MKESLLTRIKWTAYLARHLRGQSAFPYRSLREIERVQARRVRRMVAHAYNTVPYYRETMQRLRFDPRDFRGASDLARLPILERDQLQRDPGYFLSTELRRSPDFETASGGSTGAPRTVRWDTAAIFQNAAHSERERSIIAALVGRFSHYRESVITTPFASDRKIQNIYRERALLPSRALLQHQYLSLFDSPEKNVRLLNKFQPDIIRSYGTYLALLFSYVHATGVSFHHPKVVFYDAAELPETARQLITDTFGIHVLSAYQAIEAFKIGFECERHSGLHLNVDLYPLRIVDDTGLDVSPGENGDVVVSNLVNQATVLLNYRLGDIAHLLPEPCACGRTLPLLSFIQGRTDDWIRLSSGELIHPQAARTIFTEEPSIWQFQVVQEEADQFHVLIVGRDDRAGIRARVTKRFAERFGHNVRMQVSFVDGIAPTPGGKVKPVVSLMKASELR
jgi:phenylacetate-coenzyme A ligase PaaK-like adenylate-forming protein